MIDCDCGVCKDYRKLLKFIDDNRDKMCILEAIDEWCRLYNDINSRIDKKFLRGGE